MIQFGNAIGLAVDAVMETVPVPPQVERRIPGKDLYNQLRADEQALITNMRIFGKWFGFATLGTILLAAINSMNLGDEINRLTEVGQFMGTGASVGALFGILITGIDGKSTAGRIEQMISSVPVEINEPTE